MLFSLLQVSKLSRKINPTVEYINTIKKKNHPQQKQYHPQNTFHETHEHKKKIKYSSKKSIKLPGTFFNLLAASSCCSPSASLPSLDLFFDESDWIENKTKN